MLDLTFLIKGQVFGDNQLDIIKKYGTKSAITDFAILLGGYVSDDYYTNEGENLKDRTCYWWTRSPDGDYDAHVVGKDGNRYWGDVSVRNGGVRPTFPYSSIQSIFSIRVRENSGIKEVEYGEYPQWVVDKNYNRELEQAYSKGNLRTTGKNYTTDSLIHDDRHTPFCARTYTEYEYNESKYIRFVVDLNNDRVLSNGIKTELGKPYWVAVEPITWLVDEKADIVLSKYIILSGLQFKNRRDYRGDFDRTDIKKFMDKYLAKDIECSIIKDKLIENIENKSYDFDSIFEDAINKMNEINEVEKPKILSLK